MDLSVSLYFILSVLVFSNETVIQVYLVKIAAALTPVSRVIQKDINIGMSHLKFQPPS